MFGVAIDNELATPNNRGMNTSATQVIDALGGTAAVARIFNVQQPSVSDWKKGGIPNSRVMYLRLAYRKALAGIDLTAATAPRRARVRGMKLAQPTTQTPTDQEVRHG